MFFEQILFNLFRFRRKRERASLTDIMFETILWFFWHREGKKEREIKFAQHQQQQPAKMRLQFNTKWPHKSRAVKR